MALGQGIVDFQNHGSFITTADRLVYFGEVGGEKLVGTNYAAALYYTRPGTRRELPATLKIAVVRPGQIGESAVD